MPNKKKILSAQYSRKYLFLFGIPAIASLILCYAIACYITALSDVRYEPASARKLPKPAKLINH